MHDPIQSTQKNSHQFIPHEIIWDLQKSGRLWDYYGNSPGHTNKYFGEKNGLHLVRIAKRLGLLKNGSIIVDFSCGTGAIVEALLTKGTSGIKVYGFDPSTTSIQQANHRNQKYPGFEGAHTIHRLPTELSNGYADLLFLTEVIEHLDSETLSTVIKECQRILAPGGTLLITTPNSEYLDQEKTICPECGCIFHRWQHMRSWNERELCAYLHEVGFSQVKIKKIAWGNEIIDLCFSFLNKKKPGLLAIAHRP